MANFSRRQRARTELLAGRRRAHYLAQRLGTALREARLAAGLTQGTVARAKKVSQPEISRLEAGKGSTASIETWSSVAAATGSQLAAFLEGAPGATRPRDYEHLKRQQLVADFSKLGGWQPSVEHALDQAHARQRSVDVRLDRPKRCETAIVEVWDWFDDVGAAWRGLDAKVAAVRRDHAARELIGSNLWRVNGLIVVRATRRNRGLVRELGGLFRARFPATGRAWLAALGSEGVSMPDAAGFLWTDVRGTRLFEARL
jgi:transcriptional regulator with XRE-family HTH domain